MKIIIIVLLAVFASVGFAQDQIQSQPNQPQEGVQGWYKQNSPITGNLGHVFFKNRDTGWAAAGSTFSIWTTNGGATWQKYSDSIAVLGFIGSFGYGTTIIGSNWIVITRNNGRTWIPYNTNIGAVSNLYFTTTSRGFFSNGTGTSIIKTVDGGLIWVRDTTTTGKIFSFASLDSMTLYAVGTGVSEQTPVPPHIIQSLFLSTNGGVTWSYRPRVHYKDGGFNCAAFLSPKISIFAGSSIFSFISGDFGYSLDSIHFPDEPARHSLDGISASDKNNVTLVGEHGRIYRSYDGGEHWQIQNSSITNDLTAVTFIDSTTGWAVGSAGIILHTTNGGFSSVQLQKYDTLHAQTYPDPASTNLTLAIRLPEPQHISVSILDISGVQITQPLLNRMESSGSQTIPIDIHSLISGTYFLNIQTEKFQSVVKFTVVH